MKKHYIIVVLILVVLSFLTSCNNMELEKSATLYSNAEDSIKSDFKAAYPTAGVSPDYDWSLSKNFFWVVTSKEQADGIIESTDSFGCDFDKEMIVVYTCTSNVGVDRTYKLKSIKKSEDHLIVELTTKHYSDSSNSASAPWQRWFILKIQKTEIEFVIFELK